MIKFTDKNGRVVEVECRSSSIHSSQEAEDITLRLLCMVPEKEFIETPRPHEDRLGRKQ